MKKWIAISLLGFMLIVLSACNSKEVDYPPSFIYADDDRTVLASISNTKGTQATIAPYFCESVRNDVLELLSKTNAKGEFIYAKKDGTPYDLYKDQLKIYTSINPTMQAYAEAAVRRHLSEDLQAAFTENNRKTRRFPFADTYNGAPISNETVYNIIKRSQKSSRRFRNMSQAGIPEEKILASFKIPVRMKLFSWKGTIDTVMTPNDSIRYAKNMLRSSVLSIEPRTGHVKVWVGGINFDHFPEDNIRETKRQMGSTIRPIVYATAFSMGVAEPCTEFSDDSYCVDPCEPGGGRWCPQGSMQGTVKGSFGFSHSPSIPIMSLMGSCAGPATVAKVLEGMGFEIPEEQVVPSISLGSPDASLLQIVSAHAMFVNHGLFVEPQTVLRIEDRHGNVIYSAKAKRKGIYHPDIAFDLVQLMQRVVSVGQGCSLRGSAKWGGITYPTAATAGTTQGNSDAWFIGMTPDLVTGIWGGAENKQIRFRSMAWGQGARMCLPIYGYFMQKIYADSSLTISKGDFVPPKDYDPKRFDCGEVDQPKDNPFGI